MKKFLSLIISAAMALTCLSGCSRQVEYEKYSTVIFNVFDTIVSVVSYQESKEDFDEMSDYIEERYIYLNKLFDIYNDYTGINNIKTINDNAGKEPVKVEQEIIDLLTFSKEWYEKSDGKMNIAMGSVLKVWHNVREFYSANGYTELPDMSVLQEKAKHIDINCVVIDAENMTVFITDPQVQLDVGAVAKGFATEIICDELNEKYDNYAISAGGNVKTHGSPKDGRNRWGIGIQNPAVDENFNMIGGNLDMAYFNTDMSLVCSGGYQRYFVVDGRRYHHIIDPVTLYPEEVYQGVTVICEDSGMADALSTSIFLSDVDTALALINSVDGAECILVEIDGTVHMTDGAAAYLASYGVDSMTE